MSSDDDMGKKRTLEETAFEENNKRLHVDGSAEKAIKILVSNKDAGTVIGRKGATIASLQSKSGSHIRVSSSGEYFPGTEERVVLIKGSTQAVQSACDAMFTELFSDSESWKQQASAGGIESDPILTVNLLIPDLASGLIIGKGGENIKRMVEESSAKIQLSGKEKQVPGIPERVITLNGTLKQVTKASCMIVEKLAEDPKCMYQNMTTQYKSHPPGPSGMGFGAPPMYGRPPMDMYGPPPDMYGNGSGMYQQPPRFLTEHGGGGYGGMSAPRMMDSYGGMGMYGAGAYGMPPAAPSYSMPPVAPTSSTTYTISVQDHVVPAILGRGGQVIREMMDQVLSRCRAFYELSGATIKVSQKGEYAPGTTNRIVTITGTAQAAAYAHQLVSARIPTM